MKRTVWFVPALLIPALATAQAPTTPNANASDIAKSKAAAGAPRAKQVRGEAVGLDNQPVSAPASPSPATKSTGATPHPGEGPATPATPATPSSHSKRPDHAGQGGQGRSNNPRRP